MHVHRTGPHALPAPDAAGGAPWTGALLLLLLSVDALLVVGHLLLNTGLVEDPRFGVDTDRGFPELFQYAKFAVLLVVCAGVAARRRRLTYGAFAVAFLYLLVDDALQVHELSAGAIVRALSLGPVLGVSADAVAEVAVTLVIGVALLVLIALSARHAGRADQRFAKDGVVCLGFIALVGVGLDLLTTVLQGMPGNLFLILAEDVGEMLVVSCVLWFVLGSVRGDRDAMVARIAARSPARLARRMRATIVVAPRGV